MTQNHTLKIALQQSATIHRAASKVDYYAIAGQSYVDLTMGNLTSRHVKLALIAAVSEIHELQQQVRRAKWELDERPKQAREVV